MPSCNNMPYTDERISLKKELRTQFTVLSVWASWLEKQKHFHEDQAKMNLQSNIQKMQTFRKSAAILDDVKYSICSSLDFEYRVRVIIFTQERAPRQRFIYLRSTIETLKRSVKSIQS